MHDVRASWEKFIAIEPWEGLGSDPRTADTSVVRLATYNGWFAVPQGDGQAQEKGYPKGMPNYTKHTGGIPFAQVKQLMRFRTGAHHLRVETGRWLKPRLPRSLTEGLSKMHLAGSTVEDEYHVLFECPAYHRIRLKYGTALFSKFGGVSRVARSLEVSWQG